MSINPSIGNQDIYKGYSFQNLGGNSYKVSKKDDPTIFDTFALEGQEQLTDKIREKWIAEIQMKTDVEGSVESLKGKASKKTPVPPPAVLDAKPTEKKRPHILRRLKSNKDIHPEPSPSPSPPSSPSSPALSRSSSFKNLQQKDSPAPPAVTGKMERRLSTKLSEKRLSRTPSSSLLSAGSKESPPQPGPAMSKTPSPPQPTQQNQQAVQTQNKVPEKSPIAHTPSKPKTEIGEGNMQWRRGRFYKESPSPQVSGQSTPAKEIHPPSGHRRQRSQSTPDIKLPPSSLKPSAALPEDDEVKKSEPPKK